MFLLPQMLSTKTMYYLFIFSSALRLMDLIQNLLHNYKRLTVHKVYFKCHDKEV